MRISNFTHYLGAPKDWKPEDGKCSYLAVRIKDNRFSSAWELTPAELKLLNEGGSIVLSIFGGQPPVMLTVEPVNK